MLAALRARPALRTALRIGAAIVIVGLVVWLVLVPQIPAARADIQKLASVSPMAIVAAALAEAASLLVFSLLTRTILGRGGPSYGRLLPIDLADLAANHTLPGGGATAAAIRFRLLHAEGLSTRRALTAATVETVISNLVLGGVFLIGAIGTIGRAAPSAALIVAVAAVLVLSAASVVATWGLLRHGEAIRRGARAVGRRVPLLTEERAEGLVIEATRVVREILRDRRRSALAAITAAGNWLLDATALWLVLWAFGASVDPLILLAAYGVATILAQLPLTPGGLGIVEATLTVALTGFGVAHGPALLGVLGWRVLEYWLPIPIGWACYLFLRIAPGGGARDVRPSPVGDRPSMLKS
ncbi:MAG TPA: YbhN family protein [Pseudolysinimonas sp.]|nr:YbhN family protein [Pseudolysinimonas sp.]